jgi:hypothetical protein
LEKQAPTRRDIVDDYMMMMILLIVLQYKVEASREAERARATVEKKA